MIHSLNAPLQAIIEPDSTSDNPEKKQIAAAKFPEWSPDHIHFEGELLLRFYDDGEVWAYAGHLAHHNQGTGAVGFYFVYELRDRNGGMLHTNQIHLATLTWKQELNNVQRSMYDGRVVSLGNSIDWSKSRAGPRREV